MLYEVQSTWTAFVLDVYIMHALKMFVLTDLVVHMSSCRLNSHSSVLLMQFNAHYYGCSAVFLGIGGTGSPTTDPGVCRATVAFHRSAPSSF